MAKQAKRIQTATSTKKSGIRKPKKTAVTQQPLNHVIGKVIAKYRKNAGLSQEQLAEKLGLGNEAISRIKRGIVIPTVERIIEMAEIFDCPVSELLTEISNLPSDEIMHLYTLLSSVSEEDKQMLFNLVETLAIRLKSNKQDQINKYLSSK